MSTRPKLQILSHQTIKLLFISIAVLPFCSSEPDEEPPNEMICFNYTDPDWSPDGNLIIYEYGGNAYGTDTPGIFLFDLRDSTTQLLFDWDSLRVQTPDFSPDGEWITYNDGCGIWKTKINGSSRPIQLTFGRETFFADWSPDGKKIAYDQSISTLSHERGIYIMDADGNNDRLIIKYARCPKWSPNGAKIAYDGVYVADTNGTNIRQIHQGGVNVAWSPDGSKIAFATAAEGEGPRIYVINVDGTNLKEITDEGGDTPCWSPDGSKIVYTNTKYGEIWIMNPDGTDKRKLIGHK